MRVWLPVLASSMLFSSTALSGVDGFAEGAGMAAEPTGVELGVRTGYGSAAGRYSKGQRVRRYFAAGAPVAIELGYRFDPRWFVGGYGEYALGFASRLSDTRCQNCTHSWLHLGVEVQYRLAEWQRNNVWLTLGLGQHSLNLRLDDEAERSQVASGFDVNLSVGSEWRLQSGVAIGPYTAFSVGSFSGRTESCLDDDLCPRDHEDLGVRDPGLHLWFSSGIRVVFLP
jgi:hypothetical protein